MSESNSGANATTLSVAFTTKRFDATVTYYLSDNPNMADATYMIGGLAKPSKVIAMLDSDKQADVIVNVASGSFADPDTTIYIADSSGMANREICFTDDWMRATKTFQFADSYIDGALNVFVDNTSLRADHQKVLIVLDSAKLLD